MNLPFNAGGSFEYLTAMGVYDKIEQMFVLASFEGAIYF